MSWDPDGWARRLGLRADGARTYAHQNRQRIAGNDPRRTSVAFIVDQSEAKADFNDDLIGYTGSLDVLRGRVLELQRQGPRIMPPGLFDKSTYVAAWQGECNALLAELAAEDSDARG
jgi:hypothetical protein